MRWGDFVEALYRCELIEPVEPGTDTIKGFKKILSRFQKELSRDGTPPDKEDSYDTGLYLIAIEVRA